MSFHKQEFHETKRERKYYEDKKQKALRVIYDLKYDMLDHDWRYGKITKSDFQRFDRKMKEIIKMVNDI